MDNCPDCSGKHPVCDQCKAEYDPMCPPRVFSAQHLGVWIHGWRSGVNYMLATGGAFGPVTLGPSWAYGEAVKCYFDAQAMRSGCC